MTIENNITIITAIYPPEPQVSARMCFDLAHYLAGQGHCVTVVCPQPSRPLSADYRQYVNPEALVETNEDKVRVVRLPSFAVPQSRLISRMRESISFGHHVVKYLANQKTKPDVIYVNSWPMFSQALIARFAKKSAVPMVLQIMDVYPEALTGKLPVIIRSLVHVPLKKLDEWIAGASARVVTISGNMRRIYAESRQILAERVVVIPTWQDEAIFKNIPSRAECCDMYGIPAQLFTFLFLGNIGPVACVEFLIDAFAKAGIADAQFLIVGDGANKSNCLNLVQQMNLPNVRFISDPDTSNVPLLQGMAHVCMLPMKRGAGMSSIPSKLAAYLFSARPVIATVDRDSDTARFVNQAECGWVGDAEDLDWLVTRMKEVSTLPIEQLEMIGQRGRNFGLANFSKASGVAHLADTILRAAGSIK